LQPFLRSCQKYVGLSEARVAILEFILTLKYQHLVGATQGTIVPSLEKILSAVLEKKTER